VIESSTVARVCVCVCVCVYVCVCVCMCVCVHKCECVTVVQSCTDHPFQSHFQPPKHYFWSQNTHFRPFFARFLSKNTPKHRISHYFTLIIATYARNWYFFGPYATIPSPILYPGPADANARFACSCALGAWIRAWLGFFFGGFYRCFGGGLRCFRGVFDGEWTFF
jgi:hypothetical protein